MDAMIAEGGKADAVSGFSNAEEAALKFAAPCWHDHGLAA
jgi:hypothetical protein